MRPSKTVVGSSSRSSIGYLRCLTRGRLIGTGAALIGLAEGPATGIGDVELFFPLAAAEGPVVRLGLAAPFAGK